MVAAMHTKKEQTEATLLTTNQIRTTNLNVASGLWRLQAHQATSTAARNVNAYGQKEEGPSKWQERKEAKRQMYLMSTEKAVKLGVRKDNKVEIDFLGGGVRCQRCLRAGHWTSDCKNERVYVSRPSQTQQLHNPALRQPLLDSCDPLTASKTELEVGAKQIFKSNMFATVVENNLGRKSNRTPPRKSDFRNRKRRRSRSSRRSSSTSSSEESPSKSRSNSEEEIPSSSDEPTSTTHSSSTFSSPSRTTSSSRKSSSCSSTDPPTPESDSKDTRPVIPLVGNTKSECQLTNLSFCKNEK